MQYFNRRPNKFSHVTKNVNHFLIPKTKIQKDIIDSGINIEIYDGACLPNNSVFGIWSPHNGGTIVIDVSSFINVRWYDRQVLLELALFVNERYARKELIIKDDGRVIWYGLETDIACQIQRLMLSGDKRKITNAFLSVPWITMGIPKIQDGSYIHRVHFMERCFVGR